MNVLITGGAGYIGSTIASACRDSGIVPIILDDLSRGRPEFTQGLPFYRGDIADGALLDTVFAAHPDIDATVHCAGRVVVPESVRHPISYYRTNVGKTLELIEHLRRNGCRRLLFSSSASVYAPDAAGRVDEQSAVAPSSPYARTKAIVEMALEDIARAYPIGVLSLRYFNPIGADPRLRTGPCDPDATHVVGKLLAALTHDQPFHVTGVHWPTRDGTGIRDYVHVWDLAQAHVAGLLRFDEVAPPGHYEVVNLGTGRGTTVRELVAAFQEVAHRRLTVVEGEPRDGDVVGVYCCADKAARLLGWQPIFSVRDGLRHALQWEAARNRMPAASASPTGTT